MSIRGSTPHQRNELGGSVVHTGLADPGPTYCDITLRANDDETQAPRKFRLEGVGELFRGHAQ
jgi:hypothetical protein